MSSTILTSFGSVESGGGASVGEGSAGAAVASHLDEPARGLEGHASLNNS